MKTIAPSNLVVALLLLAVSPATWAADYHEGLAAHRRGDFEAALREWRPLAAQGDSESQYRLARMYYHGEGERNDALAAQWYEQAAEQGHVKAQNNIGMLYEQGRGVEQDASLAVGWYRRAADQGLATAQSNLARMYDRGLGVAQDGAEAAVWYRRAAEQGHAQAQYRLGRMFDQGTGVPSDLDKAAKWYRRAAKQGYGPAQAAIGSMYADGRGVSRDVEKATKWLGRASAQGIAVSTIVKQAAPDSAPAEAAYTDVEPTEEEASDAPETQPAVEIADSAGLLPTIEPTRVDAPEVVDSVASPSTASPVPPPPPPRSPTTAELESVPFDYPELQEITQRADDGDAPTQYRLAQMYSTGEGAPQRLDVAARWYRAAAEQNHDMAAYKLAFLYLRGRGVPNKDYAQAYRWFSVSAELGVGDAGRWRDRIREKMTKRELAEAQALVDAWNTEERN
jgi:TPR repeat protein